MRIGIQQTALGKASLVKCFAMAKRAQAEGVGLCYRTAEEARNLADPAYVSELRARVDQSDLAITGLSLGVLCRSASLIGPADAVARSQELIRQAILMATRLGKVDVIVPFFGRNRIELPEEFDTAAKAIAELAETAEDHGVVLAVDSSLHVNLLHHFLAECASEFVKACLDTGEVTVCYHNPFGIIRSLSFSRITQIHLKEVRVVYGLPPDFNVRLGAGNVQFNAVAAALRSIGYHGWLVLDTPPGDSRGTIASTHIKYVRRLFGLDHEPQPLRKGTAPAGSRRTVEKWTRVHAAHAAPKAGRNAPLEGGRMGRLGREISRSSAARGATTAAGGKATTRARAAGQYRRR